MLPAVKMKIALAGALILLSSACGASQDDKIVMKSTENGSTRTYAEVRDMFANGDMPDTVTDCAEFAGHGSKNEGIQFPEGQALFVEACEEGMKEKQGS
jgi:hypothetical protein